MYYVVWMDSHQAKIFDFSPDSTQGHKLKSHTHHSHTHGEMDKQNEEKKFFHELATHLKPAKEILICGPGVAKEHFKHYLADHHFKDVAEKIVGVETLDHPTDNQIIAFAHKWYKKHNLFT